MIGLKPASSIGLLLRKNIHGQRPQLHSSVNLYPNHANHLSLKQVANILDTSVALVRKTLKTINKSNLNKQDCNPISVTPKV